MVPEARLELARLERRGILNILCTWLVKRKRRTLRDVPSQYIQIHPQRLVDGSGSYTNLLVCKA